MALEEILAWKRRELEDRPGAPSGEPVLERCSPSDRSLRDALRRGGPGFILELKQASPSAGRLVEVSRREEILSAYAPHADAVSVVTDARFFGGSMESLELARRLTDLPVLCKDFVLEPRQVAEARLHGADAILLILAAVDDAAWRACAAAAERLKMDVLTEVHDEAEARRAVELGAPIVGINNRDLRTLEVDRGTVGRLAPLVPEDRLVVAESGIRTRADVMEMRPCADAFLVGTSLLQDPGLEMAIRRLVYGMTKICGLTSPAAAGAAWEAGATHGGLVFASPSPRRVSVDGAGSIRRGAPLEWVGVFVDEEPAEVAGTARLLDLHAVQLHGGEGPEEIARLRGLLPAGCGIWKAVRVRRGIPDASSLGADRILLDSWSAERRGGTGTTFDWSVLEEMPRRGEVILSGGLHPGNAARAAATGVPGLDVSSGVESAPGIKDPDRMREFLRERRRLPGRTGGPA